MISLPEGEREVVRRPSCSEKEYSRLHSQATKAMPLQCILSPPSPAFGTNEFVSSLGGTAVVRPFGELTAWKEER